MQVDLQTKTALWGGVASGIGKFMSEYMPKGFKAIQSGAGKIGLDKIKHPMIAGSLVGSGIGAVSGAAKAEPGERGSGALGGAIKGGLIGGAAGWGAGKLPNLGNKLISEFAPAGKKLMEVGKANPNIKFTELMDRGSKYMQKNFADQWAPLANSKNFAELQSKGQIKNVEQVMSPKGPMKTFFGTNSTPEFIRQGQGHTMLAKGLAETGNAWLGGRTEGIKGIGKVLKNDFTDKMYFTKDIAGKTYRGKRSLVGRVVNPLLASGVGMGAITAATTEGENGQKPTLGKRLRRGAVDTALWGLAPPIGAAKAVYDTSKSFTHKNNN